VVVVVEGLVLGVVTAIVHILEIHLAEELGGTGAGQVIEGQVI
jgi:hypothetical protein